MLRGCVRVLLRRLRSTSGILLICLFLGFLPGFGLGGVTSTVIPRTVYLAVGVGGAALIAASSLFLVLIGLGFFMSREEREADWRARDYEGELVQ